MSKLPAPARGSVSKLPEDAAAGAATGAAASPRMIDGSSNALLNSWLRDVVSFIDLSFLASTCRHAGASAEQKKRAQMLANSVGRSRVACKAVREWRVLGGGGAGAGLVCQAAKPGRGTRALAAWSGVRARGWTDGPGELRRTCNHGARGQNFAIRPSLHHALPPSRVTLFRGKQDRASVLPQLPRPRKSASPVTTFLVVPSCTRRYLYAGLWAMTSLKRGLAPHTPLQHLTARTVLLATPSSIHPSASAFLPSGGMHRRVLV